MRHRVDYSTYEGLTKEEIQRLNEKELVNWPILSIPFTAEDIRNFSETEFKKLLWLTRTLLEIHSDIDGRSDYGEPEPPEDYSLPIDLKKFGYDEATGLASSMAGVELEQCLSELKRREYIPSYGIGLNGTDRILYIGWSAHIVAITELYDSLVLEWKLRQNIVSKTPTSRVRILNFKEAKDGDLRLTLMVNGVSSQEISVANKGGWSNLYLIAKNGQSRFENATMAKKMLDQFSDARCKLWTDGRFEKTKIIRVEQKSTVMAEIGIKLSILNERQWTLRINNK